MNLKKTLAILLAVAQLVTLAVFSAAAGPDEFTGLSERPIPADMLEPDGTISSEEILPGLIDPGDPLDPERVWVRRIELNCGDIELLPMDL